MLECSHLTRDIKRERIPAGVRKALGIRRTHYDSIADKAIIAARVENSKRLVRTSAGEAIIGSNYQLIRQKALSEQQALKKLKSEYDRRGAAGVMNKYVVTASGRKCNAPCTAKVNFSDQGLDMQCTFEHRFKRSSTVHEIQAEVLRIAKLLGMKPAKLPFGALKSSCKPVRKDKDGQKKAGPEIPVLTEAQRVMGHIDAPFLMQPFKGAMMWHTVGSGKSCAAMLVANEFINKGWRVVWASTAQLKFRPATKHFFDLKCHDQPFPSPLPKTQEAKQAYLKSKVLTVVSYSTLSNGLSRPDHSFGRYLRGGVARGKNDPLHKTLIIMDEPHKMRELSGREKATIEPIAAALQRSYAASGENSGRVLYMDATPAIEDPGELLAFLNALEPDKSAHMPTNMKALRAGGYVGDGGLTAKGKDAFRRLGNGVISYLNLSTDLTKFARPIRWSLNQVAMSPSQMTKLKKDCGKAKDKRRCVEANSVATNMPAGKYDKGMDSKLAKRANESFPLLQRLVANIAEQDATDRKDHGNVYKHAIFTNVPNAGHAESIMKVLQAAGFQRVDPNHPRATGGKGVLMLSGSGLTPQQKENVLSVFNDPKNVHGQVARLLLLDGRFREGVDVYDTRHFHMLQPLARLEETQAIGRVLRMCGSTRLPMNKNTTEGIWDVKVHLYDPVDVTSGQSLTKVYNTLGNVEAAAVIGQLEKEAANIAFDHGLFKAYNIELLKPEYKDIKSLATGHLPCQVPAIKGECPAGLKPTRYKKTDLFCCEKDKPCGKYAEDKDGKCGPRFIRGVSDTDPSKHCCYGKTSKRGKALMAAAKAAGFDMGKAKGKGKAKPCGKYKQSVNGACQAGYVKDPVKPCCYSKRSKMGKAVLEGKVGGPKPKPFSFPLYKGPSKKVFPSA